MNRVSSPSICATALFISMLLSPVRPAHAGSWQTSEDGIQRIEAGKPVERKLVGGVTHSYEIKLVSGQYMKGVVLQKGIDVAVRLIGPDGKQIINIDSPNGSQGPEPIHLVASASGSYVIKIELYEKGAPAGLYELQVIEVRESRDGDRALEEALKLYVESTQLNAEKKYEVAAPLAERALTLRERIDPAELPSLQQHLKLVADISFNIASVHEGKGEYAKAEPLYQRSLANYEKAFGPEHPDVAAALNRLARLYETKREYAKAESFYLR
ncbi:MAG TPA: tetratricopeptide repeat protein, partial [Blastocatellia bacterium]|nr:tetratricopeptide repeat protein [Blastocatellia bacterium]